MKKLFLLFIALVVVGLVACAQETTELRWERGSAVAIDVENIRWLPDDGSNVSWGSETLTSVGQKTSKKETDGTYGDGVFANGATEYDIIVNGNPKIYLSDGALNDITINAYSKK